MILMDDCVAVQVTVLSSTSPAELRRIASEVSAQARHLYGDVKVNCIFRYREKGRAVPLYFIPIPEQVAVPLASGCK